MKKPKQQYQPRKGLVRQFVCSEFGHVDLDKINAPMAEKLAKAGYLVKRTEDKEV